MQSHATQNTIEYPHLSNIWFSLSQNENGHDCKDGRHILLLVHKKQTRPLAEPSQFSTPTMIYGAELMLFDALILVTEATWCAFYWYEEEGLKVPKFGFRVL